MKPVYYFLHDFDPSHDYSDGTVVSLYPRVSRALEELGVDYCILEDFYDERDLAFGQDAFFFEQLEWFRAFDKMLKSRITYLAVGGHDLAKLCMINLKYFSDELAVESFILRRFLEKTGPVEIRYVRRKREQPIGCMRAFLNNESNNFLRDLLVAAPAELGVTLVTIDLEPETRYDKPLVGLEALKHHLSRWGLLYGAAKKIDHILRYSKLRRFLRARKNPMTVLALHAGGPVMDSAIAELVSEGHRVFYHSDGAIYDACSLGERKVSDMTPSTDEDVLQRQCRGAADDLTPSDPLFDFIEKKCRWSISELALPYFRYFVSETCFSILASASKFKRFIHTQNVDLMIATNSSDIPAKAAILASRDSGTRTACFQHGMEAYANRIWHITDLDPFDFYFAAEPLSEARFKRCVENEGYLKRPCVVAQSAALLRGISARYAHRNHRLSNRAKTTILYIPTKLVSYMRHFNNLTYPIGWYYQYQKSLMDLFGSQAGRRFIYKESVSSRTMSLESIVPYFRSKKYLNISLGSGRLSDYFYRVDAIILDRPTGALFESAASGLPFLCLYPDFVSEPVAADARAFFGKTLVEFNGFEEARARIMEFLSAPADEYRVSLETRVDRVTEVLASYDRRQTRGENEKHLLCQT